MIDTEQRCSGGGRAKSKNMNFFQSLTEYSMIVLSLIPTYESFSMLWFNVIYYI